MGREGWIVNTETAGSKCEDKKKCIILNQNMPIEDCVFHVDFPLKRIEKP